MKRIVLLVVTCLLVVSAACGPRTQYRSVMVPPRVDLTEHDVIAVVEFEGDKDGKLGPLATRRFTDLARRDQGMVRMLSVGPEQAESTDGYKALGQRHGAKSLFVGSIEISKVRPNVSIAKSLRSGSVRANVDATLTVQLIESESGASIWSASARATRELGNVSVWDGHDVSFNADDPDRAYGELVDALVAQVTRDFQASWVREAVPAAR